MTSAPCPKTLRSRNVFRVCLALPRSPAARLPRSGLMPSVRRSIIGCMKSAALLLAAAASLSAQNVTFDRILHPDREPQNWLTSSGGAEGRRYSPLTQITPANVKTLELNWVWQARSTEKFEATALVVDGILYTVAP